MDVTGTYSEALSLLDEALGAGLVGVLLGGSRALPRRYTISSAPSDIDLFAFVRTDQMTGRYTIKKNSFGARLRFEDIPKVHVLDDGTVVDVLIFPVEDLSDVHPLASSHAQYALGPNLYWGDILLDKTGSLSSAKEQIETTYFLQETTATRLDNASRIAVNSLRTQNGVGEQRWICDIAWDRYIWILVCIQNLVLASEGLPPTFRLQTRQARTILGQHDLSPVFEPIFSVFGLNDVGERRAREMISEADDLMAELCLRQVKNGFICDAKAHLWRSALEYLYSQGDYQSVVLPALAVQAQCMKALKPTFDPEETANSLHSIRLVSEDMASILEVNINALATYLLRFAFLNPNG